MESIKEDFYYMSPEEAILVTGVKYEIVRNQKIGEFAKYRVDMSNVYPVEGTDNDAVYTETRINLPIMRFGKMINGEPRRMYIAYSPDIEELLNKPYNIMHQDLENARIRINSQDSILRELGIASFWQRLKYLFGMGLPSSNQ